MVVRFVTFCIMTLSVYAATLPALADAGAGRDAKFLNKIEGQWNGPGEIVAGKYKGTKFICALTGESGKQNPGMSLKGDCRVGVFSQKMEAVVERSGGTYKGTFLDGALGEGLDVIAGNVTQDRIVLTLKRKELNGAMLARLANDNKLNVTVSVKVGDELVPVIGMSLNRIDSIAVGTIK